MNTPESDRFRVLAVIPAYNEEKAVSGVIKGVLDQGLPLLVIDDASKDRTGQTARQACRAHPRSNAAQVITHPENKGKGEAVGTAVKFALQNDYTHILVLDADGQHNPSEIPGFLEALSKTGADIVLGSRMGDPKNMPKLRLVSNKFSSLLISMLAGCRITDSQSGYRLISLKTWENVSISTRRYEAESEFLVKACRQGYGYTEVPIETIYADETSTFRPVMDTMRFFKLVVRLACRLVFDRKRAQGPDTEKDKGE